MSIFYTKIPVVAGTVLNIQPLGQIKKCSDSEFYISIAKNNFISKHICTIHVFPMIEKTFTTETIRLLCTHCANIITT